MTIFEGGMIMMVSIPWSKIKIKLTATIYMIRCPHHATINHTNVFFTYRVSLFLAVLNTF